MRLERLIGILSILLQKDRATTAELAEKFEVSRRTIIRDIDAINMAGIPIASEKGRGGGMYIMSSYKLDRTVLSSEEMKSILAGLQSLDSVSGTNRYKQLMDKLSAGGSNLNENSGNIIIDLAGWNKSGLSEKIELIKSAMESGETIAFCYYAPSGDSRREIEPYHLIFQWSGWYVWGATALCAAITECSSCRVWRSLSAQAGRETKEKCRNTYATSFTIPKTRYRQR